MTRFRQALLDELLTRVSHPVAGATPTARPSRTARLRRPGFALGGAALAALAVGAAVVATQATGTPAYAVSTNPDGTVTVTVHFTGDPTPANRALQAAGVHALVIPPSPAAACPPSEQGTPASVTLAQTELLRSAVLTNQNGVARLRPDRIPPGTILILVPITQPGRREPSLRFSWYIDPGPTCTVVDQPKRVLRQPPSPFTGPIPTASLTDPIPTASSISSPTSLPVPTGSPRNTP